MARSSVPRAAVRFPSLGLRRWVRLAPCPRITHPKGLLLKQLACLGADLVHVPPYRPATSL